MFLNAFASAWCFSTAAWIFLTGGAPIFVAINIFFGMLCLLMFFILKG